MNVNFFIPFKNHVSIILLIFAFFPSFSQSPSICSKSALAEKIYLQPDGKVYTTDKIIWFKAIVTNAVTHKPTILSGVLHVELIGPNEKLIEKKQIKIENGIGDGFFQLNQSYPEGLYLIRAYTEWNKNFESDFIFNEYIQVFAPANKENENPITNVTLIEKENNERRLNVSFNPNAIDSLQKKELTLFLSFDNRKDTLTIKRNGNKYFLDHSIPDDCQFITLKMQTENHFNFSKIVILNKDYLDLQFFPESGELVQGIQSLVGFKALDCNGKAKNTEGEIIDEKGELITSFKSNQSGMGTFTLAPKDTTTKYFARILPKSEEHPQKMVPLPKIASKGNVVSARKNGDEIQLTVLSNYLGNDSISLRVSCRGIVYHSINSFLKNGSLEFNLPATRLPEGIIVFTMMDHSSAPVAERLYFNERPENRILIAISTDKDSYMQREPARLNIETSNKNGEPVGASLSVLVLNKEQMGLTQDSRQNILTYFLLDSELKGEIENPGIYFMKDSNIRCDIDALLLTQGWRKYNYSRPVEKLNFQSETSLNVSGIVSGLLFQKKKKGIDLTMMTFGHNPTFQTQTTDSLGRFSFNVNDEYGQNVNVLIQSANKQGVKKDYAITLDKKESPPVVFKPPTLVENVDSVVHAIVERNIERKKVEDAFPLSTGDILLDEVVVEGYRMTPERKKVAEKYGKPDRIIEGKAIVEKEEKWSYGLYSVLMFNFPDKVMVSRARDGNLYARVKPSEMTLVVIDGIPVKPYEYPFIPNIPPSEVKSFEIIENAKNFSSLYCELFPKSCQYAPAWGDVIAIYTYAGHGIYGANRAEGILKTTIPVFSAPREFYSPKYDKLKSEDWFRPDLRALVHWEPRLRTDSLGKTSATFYNADNLGKMLVVVEAISEKGEIGYQKMEYDVTKRQFEFESSQK